MLCDFLHGALLRLLPAPHPPHGFPAPLSLAQAHHFRLPEVHLEAAQQGASA